MKFSGGISLAGKITANERVTKEGIILLPGFAGVDQLSTDLTINGITVSPSIWLLGGAATATELVAEVGAGGTLPIAGTGTLPTLNGGSPLGQQGNSGSNSVNDDSVTGTLGKNYESATGVNLGTDDAVFELLLIPREVSGSRYFITGYAAGGGWRIYFTSTTIWVYIRDATLAAAIGVQTTGLTLDVCIHVMAFLDRSGFMQLYVNGVASGSPSDITSAPDISSPAGISVFSDIGGATPSNDTLLQFAAWHSPAWLDTHLQATVAATRFRQLRGLVAQFANGDEEPTEDSRASAAYVQRVEADTTRKLYQVGSGWAAPHEHPPGSTRAFIRVEPAVTAAPVQSEDLASWSLKWNSGGVTISSDTDTAPNSTATADRVIEAATTGLHLNADFAWFTALDQINLMSVYFKSIDRRYAVIGMLESGGVAVSYAIVDLDDGSVTLSTSSSPTRLGPPLSVLVDDLGGGWWRCHVATKSVIAYNVYVACGVANNATTISFLGDPATYPGGIAFWGAMITDETATGFRRHGSYIPTTTAMVTRAADALRYEGLQNLGLDGNALKGHLSCRVWLPNAPLGTDRYVFSLNDGGSSADRIEAFIAGATGYITLQIESTEFGSQEINIAGSTALNDGQEHKLDVVWNVGSARVYVDSVLVASGSPTEIPNALDRIDIGASYTGICLGTMHIADLKIGGY